MILDVPKCRCSLTVLKMIFNQILISSSYSSTSDCEMMLLCVTVKNCFQMAENGLTGGAASVGCALLKASMNHSKGGSENVCVKYDTDTALALTSLDVVF